MTYYFSTPSLPANPLNDCLGAKLHVPGSDPFSKGVKQVFVSILGSERALAFNLFLCAHALNQPVRTDHSGIGRIEAAYISDGALPGFLQFWIAIRVGETPLQES